MESSNQTRECEGKLTVLSRKRDRVSYQVQDVGKRGMAGDCQKPAGKEKRGEMRNRWTLAKRGKEGKKSDILHTKRHLPQG